jgi:hypothetical protein
MPGGIVLQDRVAAGSRTFSAAGSGCARVSPNAAIGSTGTALAWRSTASSGIPVIGAWRFFLGQGFLEVAGRSKEAVARGLAIWLQVRDVQAEYERLRVAGVRVRREPKQESWGLVEMWIEDPDGVRIVLVEVPENHPLRRDQR